MSYNNTIGSGDKQLNDKKIVAVFQPITYTPTESDDEGDDKISSHFKGIDNYLLSITQTGTTTGTLTFNNPQIISRLTQTSPLFYTFNPTGSILGNTITLIIDANNQAINFDSNVFIKLSGDVIPNKRNYIILHYVGFDGSNHEVLYTVSSKF